MAATAETDFILSLSSQQMYGHKPVTEGRKWGKKVTAKHPVL